MKKVLFVSAVSVFLLMFAAPLFAVEADWSGEFTFGGITDFESDAANVNNAYADAYFDASLLIDDYNEVLIELFANSGDFGIPSTGATATSADARWGIGVLFLESDLGAYVGLPIGLMAKAGFYNLEMREYEVTGLAFERPVRPGTGNANQFNAIVDADMLELTAGWSMDAGSNNDYAAIVSIPEIGPMSVEAGYLVNTDFEGQFQVNARALAIADLVDLAAGFTYDTSGGATTEWFWGAGAAVSYKIATFGVSVNGMEDMELARLGVDLNVEQGDLGADIGAGLNLDDAFNPETFGGIEVSVYYTPGASLWRVGYLYENDGLFIYNAPTFVTGGAVGVDPPIGEGGGLFFSADIDI
jgi:hypothetical protein